MRIKNTLSKSLSVWIVLFLVVIGLSHIFYRDPKAITPRELSYSALVQHIEKGDVKSVRLQGQNLTGDLKDGQKFASFVPQEAGLIGLLQQNQVEIQAVPEPKDDGSFSEALLTWLPMILFIGIWVIMMRQMAASNGKALSFGKSKARLMSGKDKVTFADVAGIDEAKEDLIEIVDFLKDPPRFQRLGGKIPRGGNGERFQC